MSGHSKWHNIQAKKGKTDAKRGKIFTKLGKEIVMAVKNGGANQDTNAKLRDVIAKAKAENMPNDTISKAIKKASGELSSVNYENIVCDPILKLLFVKNFSYLFFKNTHILSFWVKR